MTLPKSSETVIAGTAVPTSVKQVPHAKPEHATPRSFHRVCALAWPLLTAAVLSLSFLTHPKFSLSVDVESAWTSVLSYAHQNGWQFGTEIIYPYGPLGFLLIPHFTTSTNGLRMVFDCLLCFSVSSAVCLLAWRFKLGWRLLTVAIFTLVVVNKQYGVQDLLLDFGLLAWALLCVVESRRFIWVFAGALVIFAGFSGLAKVTCLVSGLMTVGVITVDFFIREKRALAIATSAGYVGTVLILWTLAGQATSNLPSFVWHGLVLCRDYDSAMAVVPHTFMLAGLLVALFMAAGLVFLQCTFANDQRSGAWPKLRRAVILIWLLSFLFLSWKHGMVRADRHHNYLFLGFMAVFFLVLEAVPIIGRRWRLFSYGLAGTGSALALILLQTLLAPETLHLDRAFTQAVVNSGSLIHPWAYTERMTAASAQQRKTMDLPGVRQAIGTSSVDVFGNYQAHAIVSGLNFQPRPVFQSYAAYSEPLMKVNEEFYFSQRAPKYVLATLEPIDQRFPPLEDALVFRDLLINYNACGLEGGFILLKSKSQEPPRLKLLSERIVRAGDSIELTRFGDTNIWMEIRVEANLAGLMRRVIYQPPSVGLDIELSSATNAVQHFNAPVPMLAAGFLASPLVTNDDQLVALYSGKPSLRPKTYTVTFSPGGERYWRDSVRFRIYQIENKLGGQRM